MHSAYQNQLKIRKRKVLHAHVAGIVLSFFLFCYLWTIILSISLPTTKERPQQRDERNRSPSPPQPPPQNLLPDDPFELPRLSANPFHDNLLPHHFPHPSIVLSPKEIMIFDSYL